MDADQWPLGLDVLNKHVEAPKAAVIERKPRPQKEQALNCPRCNSTNTKFCYYNNYNLSQPRYFCKTCRRYWTEGGTLRNVPVGGGSRKNKRSSSSSSSSSSSTASVLKKLPDLTSSTGLTTTTSQNPKIHGGQDLNLAFDHNLPVVSDHHRVYNTSSFGGEGKASFEFDQNPNLMPSSLELFKEGGVNVSSRGLSFLGSMHLSDANNTMNLINNPSLISSHSNDYFKPRFNFCLDGQLDHMGNYGNTIMQVQQQPGVLQETSGTRPFHLYDDHSKHFATSISDHQYEQQNKGQAESSGGCWSGMLGGGSW